MDQQQILSCALDIGEQMLISGAEVRRVELAISMICNAYGCRRADVFIITSSMILTIEDTEGNYATQTRRLTGTATDLDKLHKLNALSRQICAETPDYQTVQQRLDSICKGKPYPLWLQVLASGLIAFAFTVFFGGIWTDGIVAFFLGLGLRLLTTLLQKIDANQIIVNVVASFVVSISTIALVRWGLGRDIDKILIGNIMLLIPGIALTNSIRNLIIGDTVSGLTRFTESLILAGALAGGFMLSIILLGGAV